MGDEHKASRPTAQQGSHNDLARAIAAAVGAGGTVEAALDIVRTATTRYGAAPITLDVSVPAPAPLNKPPGTVHPAKLAAVLREFPAMFRGLNLARNAVEDARDGNVIAALECATGITHLDMSNNKLGQAGGLALAQSLSSYLAIETLNLAGNGMRATSMVRLAACIDRWRTLAHLDLSGNAIGRTAAAALSRGLCECTTLQTLNLSRNTLGGAGDSIASIARSSPQLTTLDVSHNMLTDEDGAALGQAVAKCPRLTSLDVSSNNLGANAAGALATNLRHAEALSTLLLNSNPIPWESARDLVQELHHNSRLTELDASDIGFTLERRPNILGFLRCPSLVSLSVSWGNNDPMAVGAEEDTDENVLSPTAAEQTQKLQTQLQQRSMAQQQRQQVLILQQQQQHQRYQVEQHQQAMGVAPDDIEEHLEQLQVMFEAQLEQLQQQHKMAMEQLNGNGAAAQDQAAAAAQRPIARGLKRLPDLRSLTLLGVATGDGEWAKYITPLRSLTISSVQRSGGLNVFDDPLIVINLCAALSACANLEALTLRGVLPGFDQSANAVVQALQTCGNLSTLVLECGAGPMTAESLTFAATHHCWPRLEHISVAGQQLGEEAAAVVRGLGNCGQLKTLDIRNVMASATVAQPLGYGLQAWRGLEKLALDAALNPSDVKTMFSILPVCTPKLNYLEWSGPPVDDATEASILDSLRKLVHLQELHLSSMGVAFCSRFASDLSYWPVLRTVRVSARAGNGRAYVAYERQLEALNVLVPERDVRHPLIRDANTELALRTTWEAWVPAVVDGDRRMVLPLAPSTVLIQDEGQTDVDAIASRVVRASLECPPKAWWKQLLALVGALQQVLDFVLDLAVCLTLLRDGDTNLGITSAAILGFYALYSAALLAQLNHRWAAVLQLVSLGTLFETCQLLLATGNSVIVALCDVLAVKCGRCCGCCRRYCGGLRRSRITGMRVPILRDPTGYSWTGIQRMQFTEAMLEGVPQFLLKGYVAARGDVTGLLGLSLANGAFSLARAFVGSDVAAVTANALAGLQGARRKVVEVPPGITYKVPDSGSMFAKAWGAIKSVRPAPDPYITIMAYRSAAILGRLSAATLFAYAFGPVSFVMLAVSLILAWHYMGANPTWLGPLVTKLGPALREWVKAGSRSKQRNRKCVVLGGIAVVVLLSPLLLCLYVLLHPVVLMKAAKAPRQLVAWLSVALITTVDFPGVAHLTLPAWARRLSSHTYDTDELYNADLGLDLRWTCSNMSFGVLRAAENAVLLLSVLAFGDSGDFSIGSGRLWRPFAISALLCVVGALLFPVYLWRVGKIRTKKFYVQAPTVREHMEELEADRRKRARRRRWGKALTSFTSMHRLAVAPDGDTNGAGSQPAPAGRSLNDAHVVPVASDTDSQLESQAAAHD